MFLLIVHTPLPAKSTWNTCIKASVISFYESYPKLNVIVILARQKQQHPRQLSVFNTHVKIQSSPQAPISLLFVSVQLPAMSSFCSQHLNLGHIHHTRNVSHIHGGLPDRAGRKSVTLNCSLGGKSLTDVVCWYFFFSKTISLYTVV